MKASEFEFEVGDRVQIRHGWGELEDATISRIPDGAEIHEVELEFETGDFGVYRPEDCLRKEG